jgi:hypothetical protein
MSKFDRYKKAHKVKHNPITNRVLPHVGDYVTFEGATGICVESIPKKYATILCLDGKKRIVA